MMRHLGIAALLVCGACIPAQSVVHTTIETRDPQAVTVVRIAPWYKTDIRVDRDPSGALVASTPQEPNQVLVSREGTIKLDADTIVNVAEDPISTWMFYDAPGEGSRGTPKTLGQITLRTPRSNVRLVTERSGPAGGFGALFLATGALFLGGAAFAIYGAATTDGPGNKVGLALFATLCTSLAAYGIVEGLYRIVGKTEVRTIYSN